MKCVYAKIEKNKGNWMSGGEKEKGLDTREKGS